MHSAVLETRTRVFGDNSLEVATTHTNIGVVYGRQGDHENAHTQFQKALGISMSVVGSNHPDVAKAYVNLAWINMKQGNEIESRAHLGRALQTNFLWMAKSFLQSDQVFEPVRDEAWFCELLDSANRD